MEICELELFPTPVLHVKKFLSDVQRKQAYDYCINNKHLFYKHQLLNGKSFSSFEVCDTYNALEALCKTYEEWGANNEKSVISRLTGFLKFMSFKTRIVFEYIGYSWFNIQEKDSILKDHTHACGFVGVIFLNVDEKSSPLVIQNPSRHYELSKRYTGEILNLSLSSEHSFYPVNGDLIIFPGYLYHGSGCHRNQSEERIVLSFNAY